MAIKVLKLDHQNKISAQEIYKIFQASYRVEAQLLNADNFPPLSISVADLRQKKTQFYGGIIEHTLAGIVEVEEKNKVLDICSLVVSPDYFRRGLAKALMNYVLENLDWKEAIVETGSKNFPAIQLYEGLGFAIIKKWVPEHGIEKVALKKIID